LQTILAAAVRAPNASNRQAYAIVVLEDREQIHTLCGYRGSRALLFCVDYNRITALAAHTGHENVPDGLVAFVTGAVDATLAAQNAALAAHSLGIDSLFTNGIHRVGLDKVYNCLDLPRELCFPLILLVLGYPKAEPEFLKGRLNGVGVVHWGQYHAPTAAELDELVAAYDDPARHLVLNENWRAQGFAHYMDWFFEVWNGKGFNPQETEFKQALERAGFLREEGER
jgi:nitroreductase